MTTECIDHAAETNDASSIFTTIQEARHAVLALVEQQRIANLIEVERSPKALEVAEKADGLGYMRSEAALSGGELRLVVLESPYAGDINANVTYARRAVADSLHRGESPIASHLLYTQPGILRDEDPAERALGVTAGLAWGRVADATVVYIDLGLTSGMEQGIVRALAEGRVVEKRRIGIAPPDPNLVTAK